MAGYWQYLPRRLYAPPECGRVARSVVAHDATLYPQGGGCYSPPSLYRNLNYKNNERNPYIFTPLFTLENREHTDTNTTYDLARALNSREVTFYNMVAAFFFLFPVYMRERRELR